MADYLTRLVKRSLEFKQVVHPLLPLRYASPVLGLRERPVGSREVVVPIQVAEEVEPEQSSNPVPEQRVPSLVPQVTPEKTLKPPTVVGQLAGVSSHRGIKGIDSEQGHPPTTGDLSSPQDDIVSPTATLNDPMKDVEVTGREIRFEADINLAREPVSEKGAAVPQRDVPMQPEASPLSVGKEAPLQLPRLVPEKNQGLADDQERLLTRLVNESPVEAADEGISVHGLGPVREILAAGSSLETDVEPLPQGRVLPRSRTSLPMLVPKITQHPRAEQSSRETPERVHRDAPSSPAAVRVTIGRVEVRALSAVTPLPAPPKPRRTSEILSLDEYLKMRSEKA